MVIVLRKFGIAFTSLMFRKNAGFQVRCRPRRISSLVHPPTPHVIIRTLSPYCPWLMLFKKHQHMSCVVIAWILFCSCVTSSPSPRPSLAALPPILCSWRSLCSSCSSRMRCKFASDPSCPPRSTQTCCKTTQSRPCLVDPTRYACLLVCSGCCCCCLLLLHFLTVVWAPVYALGRLVVTRVARIQCVCCVCVCVCVCGTCVCLDCSGGGCRPQVCGVKGQEAGSEDGHEGQHSGHCVHCRQQRRLPLL